MKEQECCSNEALYWCFRENVAGQTSGTVAALREACDGAAVTVQDALVAQHVAHVISNRAAQLVSVCEYMPYIFTQRCTYMYVYTL